MNGFVCFIYRNFHLASVIIGANYLFFRNTCKTENTCTVDQKLCYSFHPLVKRGKGNREICIETSVIVPSVTSPGITRPCKC